MQRLSVHDLSFRASVCSEANVTGDGSEVSGLSFINADRVLWGEVHPDNQRISLQLDPDRWLLLSFDTHADFQTASARMEAIA